MIFFQFLIQELLKVFWLCVLSQPQIKIIKPRQIFDAQSYNSRNDINAYPGTTITKHIWLPLFTGNDSNPKIVCKGEVVTQQTTN